MLLDFGGGGEGSERSLYSGVTGLSRKQCFLEIQDFSSA